MDYKNKGFSFTFSRNKLNCLIQTIDEKIVRFIFSSKEPSVRYSAVGLNQQPDCLSWKSEFSEQLTRLQNGVLEVVVDSQNEKISCIHLVTGQQLVVMESAVLTPIPIVKTTTCGEAPVVKKVKTVDGERAVVENLRTFTDRTAYRGEICLTLQADTAIHGLGQDDVGVYDYREHLQYLYQHNMRIPVPFLMTDKGFGIFFDCGSPMVFESHGDQVRMKLDAVEQMDWYIIAGETLDDIIAGFRKLTGDAPMLPKWAYGYWQSKEAYTNQQQLVEIGEKYRQIGVPLDCVVQDWNSWESGLWGNKHLDKERYPHIEEALNRLHQLNVRCVVSIWPNLYAGSEDHGEFAKAGYLLGDYSTYDALNPEARALYWKQLSSELVPAGFDGWWCDSTEPFTGPDWSGPVKRPEKERFELVAGEHEKFIDPVEANLFALRHAQGIYENQRASGSQKRVVNLTRSGYAGSQKYNTILWSGDISASWETMRNQLAEGLNFCMSGLPYWTLDAGAFFTVKDDYSKRGCGCSGNTDVLWFWAGEYNDGCNDLGYRELYTRWLEYAVFLPVFRSHGTDTPREIWNFGEKGTPFYDAIEKSIRLRYRLMPYIYSLAAGVTFDRQTIMRSLLFDFPQDKTATALSDAFMFGKSLLVCPVTEPMYYLAESKPIDREKVRRCWLPSGADWYDFETDACYTGGQYLDVPAPIDRIPVFVRAGSIIPMEKDLQFAGQQTDHPFEIHIYPGKDGEFLLYEDDGDGWNYENGCYNRISLSWNDAAGQLTIGSCNNSFPQSIRGRELLLVRHGSHPAETKVTYQGQPLTVTL